MHTLSSMTARKYQAKIVHAYNLPCIAVWIHCSSRVHAIHRSIQIHDICSTLQSSPHQHHVLCAQPWQAQSAQAPQPGCVTPAGTGVGLPLGPASSGLPTPSTLLVLHCRMPQMCRAAHEELVQLMGGSM